MDAFSELGGRNHRYACENEPGFTTLIGKQTKYDLASPLAILQASSDLDYMISTVRNRIDASINTETVGQ